MLNDSQTAEFVQLLTSHQADIYFYLRSLVFQGDHASDILGDTNLTIWAQRDTFQLGTNFRAWAFQIARHKVLQWRTRLRRDRAVFSDEMLQELSEFAESQSDPPSQRLEDLRHCMGKLSPEDRRLIEKRYGPGVSADQLAAELDRPTTWVYKALYRIRAALALCIARQMTLRQREECQ